MGVFFHVIHKKVKPLAFGTKQFCLETPNLETHQFFWGVGGPQALVFLGENKYVSAPATVITGFLGDHSLAGSKSPSSFVRSGLNSHYFHIIGDGKINPIP